MGGNNNSPRSNSCCCGNWRPKGLEAKENLFHFALKWFLAVPAGTQNVGDVCSSGRGMLAIFHRVLFLFVWVANLKLNGLKEVEEFE